MSRPFAALVALLLCFLLQPASPAFARSPIPERATLETSGRTACSHCGIGPVTRRLLVPGIAEYSFNVRVGHGPFESFGLHRVVRERAPHAPALTRDALMMAHGDLLGFDAAFLSTVVTPGADPSLALPIYLAERGIDVWGIDFRWTGVPATVPDLAFLADWDVETDAEDLGVALAVARLARLVTGQGFGRLHLLGWSRGGIISYAYLNAESQWPAALRQVKGYIPVDIYLKTNDPVLRAAACERHALTQARLDAGELADGSGQLLAALGGLALGVPADSSPIVPGLTNRQAALLSGAATFAFLPPGLAPAPFYHFTGGSFDELGVPTGLTFSDEATFFTALAGAAPWQPLKELLDSDAATCDGPEAPDMPWDDHLADIEMPVLYIGAGGGFGELGVFSTTLLGSSDVSSHVVSLAPPEARLLDFGHADLFVAEEARTLVWPVILDWIEGH